MQLPRASAGTSTHLDYGDYAEGSFEAWSEAGMPTAAGQQQVGQCLDEIRSVNARLREAEARFAEGDRAVSKAKAAFDVADQALDRATLALADGVFNTIAMRSRKDPTFVQIFGSSRVTDLTRATPTAQPELIDQMLARLDAAGDFAGKAELRAAVADASAYAKAKRDALKAADAARQGAYDSLTAARTQVRDALQRSYGALLTAYPGRRDFVEGFFFKRAQKPSSGNVVDGGPGEAVSAAVEAPIVA